MRKRILVGIMCLLLVSLFTVDQTSTAVTVKIEESSVKILSDYVAHDPILIISDSDFETQGWPGSGSVNDPYMIEGISVNAARGGHCIEIRNTTVSFIVRNCYLSHYGDEWSGGTHASVGVKIFNSTHGMVENSEFIENGVGVYILLANNTQINGNNFSRVADDSIISAISNHVIISNNICNSTGVSLNINNAGHDNSPALDISESYSGSYYDIAVVNNTFTSASQGVMILGCTSGIIMNNTAFGNDYYWEENHASALTLGVNFEIHESNNILFTNNTGIAKGVCISIRSSLNISVVKNSFTSSEFHPAYDESELAFFDYNYYSNYDGIDEDYDGIGDSPYIDLYGNIQDEHPLMYYPWYEPDTSIDLGQYLPLIAIGGGAVIAIVAIIVIMKKNSDNQ